MDFPQIFKPHAKGLRKILGDLEAEIMKVIWSKGETSVREVHEELRKSREIAYTTVMTVMGRLVNKDLLCVDRHGNKYIYTPKKTEEDLLSMVSKEVLTGLLSEHPKPILAHLVDAFECLDRDELEELMEMIQKKIETQTSRGEESHGEEGYGRKS